MELFRVQKEIQKHCNIMHSVTANLATGEANRNKGLVCCIRVSIRQNELTKCTHSCDSGRWKEGDEKKGSDDGEREVER